MDFLKILSYNNKMKLKVLILILLTAGTLTFILIFTKKSLQKSIHVIWIDSYNKGFPLSDEKETVFRNIFSKNNIDFTVFRMNSKRYKDDNNLSIIASQIYDQLNSLNVSAVIASDDAVQKYLVVPYLLNKDIPVIFCGVNWSADDYGYPAENVTGVLEVDNTSTLVSIFSNFGINDNIGFLTVSGDLTEKKQIKHYLDIIDPHNIFISEPDFESYKKNFLAAQKKCSALILGSFSAIPDWNQGEAEIFFRSNTSIPTGSFLEFMLPYTCFTVNRFSSEQAILASELTLEILKGKKPSDFPIRINSSSEIYINTELTEILKLKIPHSLLKKARIYERQIKITNY